MLLLLRVANLRHVLHLLLMMVMLRAGVTGILVVSPRTLHWVTMLVLSIWVAVLSRITILSRLSILLWMTTIEV